jgi:hypothetical protein
VTPFEKLKLPPNFEVVSTAEFLAALQPSRNIRQFKSKIIAIGVRRSNKLAHKRHRTCEAHGRLTCFAWHPSRLWSLWDIMLKVDALEFFGLGERSSAARWRVFWVAELGTLGAPGKGRELYDPEKVLVKEAIAGLSDLCTKIGLPTALELLRDRENDPPQTAREWDILVASVRAELKTNLFLFVPSHRAKYYELVLQSTVTTAFPAASKEIVAAGNSLAVGLYTACVFHSMRAAEIGVRVLGVMLDVSFPDKPLELAEWQNILDQVDSKIVAMKELPRGTKKDDELNFYSQAAVQFRYFKDAWRVRVAHARETYEESPAIKVFDHTLDFFDTLATRLREPKPSG